MAQEDGRAMAIILFWGGRGGGGEGVKYRKDREEKRTNDKIFRRASESLALKPCPSRRPVDPPSRRRRGSGASSGSRGAGRRRRNR